MAISHVGNASMLFRRVLKLINRVSFDVNIRFVLTLRSVECGMYVKFESII